ncbi:hypothetical protein HER32_12935 [Hymenobacter sp. BT18]|uniref:hypothetical protein n=1 Tax=Hymenobacter sp. BT18 TaxID=2835648 RepID=UPI00143EE1D7|nr:hypothetical protein [Hymenobacter sp. BT18]QIX62041.1 hypothetical protein HER32_12935 [Hymenobacter sp. BT18]
MADINIQRKKSSPSPWLLILLVLLVIGGAAYFLLRHDAGSSAPVSTPAASPETPLPDSTTGAETGPRPDANAAVADMSTPTEVVVAPEELAAFAASDAATPDYGRRGLQILSATLSSLADRADFRDAAISTRRDDLTSATSRLEEEGASLRPGFTAATLLLQAMQQKGYPELEADVNQLTAQADALTGRVATAQDQAALQAYLKQAARLVKALNEPPTR